MLENVRQTLKTRWTEFRLSIGAAYSTLNTAEIRKLSWAKRIGSYEDIPDSYKSFVEPFLAEGQAFPYILLTPTFEGLLQARTTEKLVCDLGQEIYILEKAGEAVRVYDYLLDGISCVEVRTVLLDSQIKIHGVTKSGLPESIVIKFNTATEDLFAPIVEKIRRSAPGVEVSENNLRAETGISNDPETLSYKFMNYVRHSLLGEEKIVQIVLQPKIQVRLLTILGKTFYKMISPAHLSILTDRELILIHEEDNPRVIGEYGKVRDYIRLTKIVDMSLCDEEGSEFSKLSIQLSDGARIESLYQSSTKPEIHQLLSRFADLRKQN